MKSKVLFPSIASFSMYCETEKEINQNRLFFLIAPSESLHRNPTKIKGKKLHLDKGFLKSSKSFFF